MTEDFLTLYLDPGEDFGWCLACGTTLLSAGTEKMWVVADAIYDLLMVNQDDASYIKDPAQLRNGVDESLLALPIKRVVCEDWRLYPDKLKFLKWDRCRTARVIGALTWFAIEFDIEMILQPASIKKAAQSAGAEEFYYRPLHENRHQNDAIQHFAFYTATTGMVDPYKQLGIPNNVQEGGDEK
jgi:hypothetical protein